MIEGSIRGEMKEERVRQQTLSKLLQSAEVGSMSEMRAAAGTAPMLVPWEPKARPPYAMTGFRIFGLQFYLSYELAVVGAIVAVATWQVNEVQAEMAREAWQSWLTTIGAVLVGIVVHELAHALAGAAFGLGVKHVFIGGVFGGGHTLFRRPDPPAIQDMVAHLAGPVANFLLAGAVSVSVAPGVPPSGPEWAESWWSVNMILAAANLVPLLGLDGGNALRAVLRLAVHNDLQATRAMQVLGPAVVVVILGGLTYWMARQPSLLIGILLFTGVSKLIQGGKFGAGREEFATLSGLSVGELMTRGIPVGPKTPLRPIVDSYLERRVGGTALGKPALPYVVMHRDGTVFGMLTDGMLAEVANARANWELATVWSAMEPIERVPVVTVETPATTAAVLAHESQCDGLLVVDPAGELVGCLTWDRLHTVMKSLTAR